MSLIKVTLKYLNNCITEISNEYVFLFNTNIKGCEMFRVDVS